MINNTEWNDLLTLVSDILPVAHLEVVDHRGHPVLVLLGQRFEIGGLHGCNSLDSRGAAIFVASATTSNVGGKERWRVGAVNTKPQETLTRSLKEGGNPRRLKLLEGKWATKNLIM